MFQISLDIELQDVEAFKEASGIRCFTCPIAQSLHRKLLTMEMTHKFLRVTGDYVSFWSEDTRWQCKLPPEARDFIYKFDHPNMFDEPAVPQTFLLTFLRL